MLSSRFASRAAVRRQFIAVAPRQHFQTSSRYLARKDTMDKDSLKPESNEYSKSGSDSGSAATDDAAFNPDKTTPEEEQSTAEGESGGVS